jgi:hypothetical protein
MQSWLECIKIAYVPQKETHAIYLHGGDEENPTKGASEYCILQYILRKFLCC